MSTHTSSPIRAMLLSELMNTELPQASPILGETITEKSITMIAGPRGVGKSWLGGRMALCAASGLESALWGQGSGAMVAYLDGEMTGRELQQRFQLLTPPDARKSAGENVYIIGRDLVGHEIGYIDTEEGQKAIEAAIPEGCRLLIIDTLSTWTQSGREDAASWAIIKHWFLRLKLAGMAIIVVHHTGKNGKQRGTSAHEDQLDTSILLDPLPVSEGQTGIRFRVDHVKLRQYHPELQKAFDYSLLMDEAGTFVESVVPFGAEESKLKARIRKLLAEGMTGSAIAKELKVSQATVSRARNQL